MNRFSVWIAALGLAIPLRAVGEATNAPPRPGVVKQIDVVVTRVDPSVIRKELAFKEGEELTPAKLDESRKNLNKLNLLRSLEIEQKWDDTLNGYRVTVKANDGWFFLPLPMFGSRGGETFAALMLMEQNFFRRSEGITVVGAYSEGRYAGMLNFFIPHFSVMGGLQESVIDEYQYTDGAVNTKQFDDDAERERPEDFGTITNRYEKTENKVFARAGNRLTPWLRASAGVSFSSVRFDDGEPALPGGEGDFNSWTLSLNLGKEGRGDPAGQGGGGLGGFGRIFGLGMAGVKDSQKPLPEIEMSPSLHLSLERAETWLGSDEPFTKASVAAGYLTLFRDRSALSVSAKGGWGDDLPASQKLSTGQRGFLAGVYAREYRGDSVAAASATYTRSFFRNMVGVLTTQVFGDYAVCWDGDEQGEKQGVGFNLAYRFWRFPLPLGSGATYSFDDENWQLSFAVGGMF